MANTTRRDRSSTASSCDDDLDLERLFRLRNVFTIALVLTGITMMLSGPLNVVSHYQQMLRNRLLYPEMASAEDPMPDAETILKNLKAEPPSTTAPPLDVDPYTIENVVRSMDIYKDNFSIVVYDPEEDNFTAFYNKKHPWLRSNAKLMGSFRVLASSLRLMFPDRFVQGTSQREFAIAIGSGDLPSTKKSMCVERHDEAPCIGDDASPILQFGSVYRGSFFPSMIPMPNPQGNHLQCYHHWARWTAEGKRDVVCNFYLPRSPSVPNGLVFGETVGLSWDDLIPQVVWRGTDFRYYIHNVRKNLRPAYLDDFEKRNVETTDEAIRALRDIYDELLPRWRGVVWTTEAEYEAELLSDGNRKVLPWANIKFADGFEDGNKTPSAEVKKFKKLGDLGVSVAGESLTLEELAKYKYHIDIGGGGGTTWSGTLEKLALPGLLFHHETLTKDYFYDKLIPWVHYVPIREDLSDLKEKYEWAEDNPRLAQRISERATLFARSLGTLDGFEEMYNQYYEHPLRSVVEAYEPLEGESWRDAMKRLTGENMVPVMKCTGYMPDGTDCDTLTDQPIEWKKFS